jgi:hypothetical protein
MRHPFFLLIVSKVENHEQFFVQERNAARTLGFTACQKITAAIRMLAYGVTGDYVDEYMRISETTTMISLKLFDQAVVSLYSDTYLRSPTKCDVARLLANDESRGFLECWGA